jgi:hypothetical protein
MKFTDTKETFLSNGADLSLGLSLLAECVCVSHGVRADTHTK